MLNPYKLKGLVKKEAKGIFISSQRGSYLKKTSMSSIAERDSKDVRFKGITWRLEKNDDYYCSPISLSNSIYERALKKKADNVISQEDWEIIKEYKYEKKKLNSEEQFNLLATAWKIQTAHFSTIFHKVNNTNYLKIIGMGEKALPYILKDLQEAPDHWFVALNAIAKPEINPVKEDDFGDMSQMSKSWIEWGKENNII
jgi:hypothetical protein